jgi:hypothetical protein
MNYDVVVETAQAELVAAVQATVPISDIARAWRPTLDQVWAFLKTHGELNPGHNLFLYHHPEPSDECRFWCPGGAPVRTAGRRQMHQDAGW